MCEREEVCGVCTCEEWCVSTSPASHPLCKNRRSLVNAFIVFVRF